jgi:hypothetical protein
LRYPALTRRSQGVVSRTLKRKIQTEPNFVATMTSLVARNRALTKRIQILQLHGLKAMIQGERRIVATEMNLNE